MKFWVSLAPKSHTSWESGNLGHANTPRGLPKHELKHKARHNKEIGVRQQEERTKFWGMLVPRDMKVDGHTSSWVHQSMKGHDTPK